MGKQQSGYPKKPDAGLTESDFSMTLEQISQELGVTCERIRQIEIKALHKARKILEARGFSLHDLRDWLGGRGD